MDGRGYFDGKAYRVRSLIEAVSRKNKVQQKHPVNPELLRWCKRNMTAGQKNPDISQLDTWGGMLMGFRFSLGISEIGNLHESDIWFETVEGHTCVTIAIRSGKTDHHQHGANRTLRETGCDPHPVLNAAQWMDRKGGIPNREIISSRGK